MMEDLGQVLATMFNSSKMPRNRIFGIIDYMVGAEEDRKVGTGMLVGVEQDKKIGTGGGSEQSRIGRLVGRTGLVGIEQDRKVGTGGLVGVEQDRKVGVEDRKVGTGRLEGVEQERKVGTGGLVGVEQLKGR